MLDLEFVRGSFPALDTPWALMDNAGGSVPARAVIDRVSSYMGSVAVQLGASYEQSQRAAEAVDAGRHTAARLVSASADEVVLGPSSTALVARLSAALLPLWREGDEVIVTNLDHETNVGAWRQLEARGITIREWRFRPETMQLELDDLRALLTERTRLVAFTHCSNIVGSIHDVARFARVVRDAGALSFVDGVAFAPHRRVDVKALGVDFYMASLYKVFGPHVGLLYGRREALLAGRSVNHYFVDETEVPYKYEPGGVVHEVAAGVSGIGDYLDAFDAHHGGDPGDPEDLRSARAFQAFADAEEALVQPLLSFLVEHPKVELLGHPSADQAQRVPTVAFTVPGRHASQIPAALDQEQVAVRCGHFYAHRACDALGLLESGGVVRASLLHYNSPAEVQRLIEGLDRALR